MNRPARLNSDPPVIPTWVQVTSFAVVTVWAGGAEWLRWSNPKTRNELLTGWLAGLDGDWLPFLPMLLLAPLLYFVTRLPRPRVSSSPMVEWLSRRAGEGRSGTWLAAIVIFLFAFAASWIVGTQFAGLPPGYHDEYSYLFQAKAFLAGRLWFPSFAPQPGLFDQVHVLNEGHFASRYFPGTGIWMAPFVAIGNPWLGHELAQAIAAMLMFWLGRELSNNGVGLLAGLLFALSPGMLLFSNLLLAHQPTLVGLLVFAWGILRFLRQGGLSMCWMAGIGLTFAMLCRPMTAAGFGLPFGVLFVVWWLTRRPELPWPECSAESDATNECRTSSLRQRTAYALGLGTPILCGIAMQLFYDFEITGSPWITPYGLYTEIYTPRHRFGFNNVVIGEQHLGPKVLENYDRWADNLTPSLAAENVRIRAANSMRWTLGIVPLLLGLLVVVLTLRMGGRRWRLILLGIGSLQLVHIPYWFSGIMGWHYVLETAPLWLLVFAEASRRLWGTWQQQGRFGLCLWWSALVSIALAVNLVTVRPLWPGRLERGIAEVRYPRTLYAEFRKQVEAIREGRKAIVFVIPDRTDRHMDYVTNPPELQGPVLVARVTDRGQLPELARLFPERLPIVFEAATREFSLLNDKPSGAGR